MKRVRVGVVGLGLMGAQYARILRQTPHVELVGLSDLDPSRLESITAELGVDGYNTHEALMESATGIEAVFVVTPEDAHTTAIIDALSRRLHVFVEKPLATTIEDCEKILELAEAQSASDLVLMVGHHSHFDPRFSQLKEVLSRGALGSIVQMYARRNLYLSSADRIRRRVSLTMWAGVHDIEIMLWLTGGQVQQVVGQGVRIGGDSKARPDAMAAILTFDCSAIGVLEYSWVVAELQGNPKRFWFELVGTGGFAEVDYGTGGLDVYTPFAASSPDMLFSPRVGDRIIGQYREEALYFLDCIVQGAVPIVSGRAATEAVRVAEAIDESVQRGTAVKLARSI